MSDSPIPFGAPDTAVADVEEVSPERRRNAVALGALAAVVLGAGAYFFLGGSEDDAESAVVQPAAAAAAPVARPAAPKAVGKLPVPSKVRLGRSPFEVLYTPPKPAAVVAAVAPASSSGGSAVTPVSTSVSGGGGGSVAPAPLAPATGSGSASGGGVAPAPRGGTTGTSTGTKTPPKLHALTLVRVYGEGKDRTGVFTINGKQQTAKVGSTFGPTAELLLLSLQQGPSDDQWTAVLQVGDGDPFDVVLGTTTHVP